MVFLAPIVLTRLHRNCISSEEDNITHLGCSFVTYIKKKAKVKLDSSYKISQFHLYLSSEDYWRQILLGTESWPLWDVPVLGEVWGNVSACILSQDFHWSGLFFLKHFQAFHFFPVFYVYLQVQVNICCCITVWIHSKQPSFETEGPA